LIINILKDLSTSLSKVIHILFTMWITFLNSRGKEINDTFYLKESLKFRKKLK